MPGLRPEDRPTASLTALCLIPKIIDRSRRLVSISGIGAVTAPVELTAVLVRLERFGLAGAFETKSKICHMEEGSLALSANPPSMAATDDVRPLEIFSSGAPRSFERLLTPCVSS